MTIDEIVQHSREYAQAVSDLMENLGAGPQAVKGQLLQHLQALDGTVDDYQLNTAIDVMRARDIVRDYDGTHILFNEEEGGFI